MEISVSVEINASKQSVWHAITDLSHCDKMISGIIDLTIIEQPEEGLVGLKWKETREMFGKEAEETMWITESVEQDYYLTQAENHGAIYVTKMQVASVEGDKTVLTMTFSGTANSWFMKMMSALMSVFMKKSMSKMLAKDLEDIKVFVEQGNQ